MRINLDWLREWIDIRSDANELADRLTTAGLEVEAVLDVAPPFSGVVVAEIVGTQRHPEADQLKVCEVSDGSTTKSVVCGAPNAELGVKAAFAPIGANLPGGIRIDRAQLRGVWSNGMLCSAKELGVGEDGEELLVVCSDIQAGTPLRECLKLDDVILDIDLTPNRGDCFSILGVAREVSAIYRRKLKMNTIPPVVEVINEQFPVSVKAKAACPSFFGRVIRNIDVEASSPAWMKERLRRAGMRPINPVVDITNYVMVELGQPLHAYDLGQLRDEIIVRFAEKNEELTLLDGQKLDLETDILVIADKISAIGIAGVMGGQRTAVEKGTTDIFLEAAFFAPDAIAGRARRYGLQTDASLRFERGVDSQQQGRAIERATALLLGITGGEAGPLISTVDQGALPKNKLIQLRKKRLEALLGLRFPKKQIEGIFKDLQMEFKSSKEGWKVMPPSFRFDLSIEEDLIEEVARLVGYEKIPSIPEISRSKKSFYGVTEFESDYIADLMVARGYTEIINYSFVDEDFENAINPDNKSIYLENPISTQMKVMRRSLWPGLLATAKQNISYQQNRLKIFEMGKQFIHKKESVKEVEVVAGLATGSALPEHWDIKIRDVDFFDVKADIEVLLSMNGRVGGVEFLAENHPALAPGQTARICIDRESVGWIGVLHPKLRKNFDIKQSIILFSLQTKNIFQKSYQAFQLYGKFPWVRRDLAVVVDESVTASDLVAETQKAGGRLLQTIVLFDVYRGKNIDFGKKSVALGLILQDTSRTLGDADADEVVRAIAQSVKLTFGATIRTRK
ncbi:MAG: phenylalanine--tRNA ligase subunit beta [Pseudomonadota bacterium]|nr:phenylalanine--tRNA ligase subunit beta [Pseudomonadota bacterium]